MAQHGGFEVVNMRRSDGGKHAAVLAHAKRQRELAATALAADATTTARVRAATTAQTLATARQPLTSTADTAAADDAATTTAARARTTTARRTTATVATTADDVTDATTAATDDATTTAPTTTAVRTPLTTSTSTTPTTTARRVATTSSSSSSGSSSAQTSSSATLGSGINGTAGDNNSSSSSSSSGGSHAGAIAGAIIAVVGVLAIAGALFWWWRKKRAAKDDATDLFPYAGNDDHNSAKDGGIGAGGGAGLGESKNYAQHQQLGSFDDLAQYAATGYPQQYEKGYGADGEKTSPGMAGYGVMSLHQQQQHQNPFAHSYAAGMDNMAGRGSFPTSVNGSVPSQQFSNLSPGASYIASAGHHDPRFSNVSSVGQFGAMYAGSNPADIANSYPPSPNFSGPGTAGVGAATPAMSPQGQAPIVGLAAIPKGQPIEQQDASAAAGPFADPQHEGKIYIVTRVFEPSMPDELVIFQGDKIQIVMSYDDGWCLGCNLTSSQRDGKPPARGVFPRECVEEYVEQKGSAKAPSISSAANVALPDSRSPSRAVADGDDEMAEEALINEDEPLAGAHKPANLERAPTLPPLEMSRFSFGDSASQNGDAQQQQQRSESRLSQKTLKKRQSSAARSAAAKIDEEVSIDDIYGGVAPGTAAPSPAAATFPPDIHVSSSESVPAMPSLPSSSAEQSLSASHSRMSTLTEETAQIIDEFPSTPRTATSPAANSPAARLSVSVNDLQQQQQPQNNRLSVASQRPLSQSLSSSQQQQQRRSISSVKRTSSLIASKDADLFLALGSTVEEK